MADLPHDGREYLTWPLTNVPAGLSIEIEFRHAEIATPTWEPMERVSETEARILLAGPDADPGTAVVLPLGRSMARTRFTSGTEIVVRSAGAVDVR